MSDPLRVTLVQVADLRPGDLVETPDGPGVFREHRGADLISGIAEVPGADSGDDASWWISGPQAPRVEPRPMTAGQVLAARIRDSVRERACACPAHIAGVGRVPGYRDGLDAGYAEGREDRDRLRRELDDTQEALARLDAVVSGYMLGDLDGGAVSRAQHAARAVVHPDRLSPERSLGGPLDGGPAAGHRWRITVEGSTSSTVEGSGSYEDAEGYDGTPWQLTVRGWSLPGALRYASLVPLTAYEDGPGVRAERRAALRVVEDGEPS